MIHDKEYESFVRAGTEPHRSYYIPFDEKEDFVFRCGILDREKSSRFVSLDGKWAFRACKNIDEADIYGATADEIDVPSCVQTKGYDQIQYINYRYPIPCNPPYVPDDNPVFHYRRALKIDADEKASYRFYLDFEGVDSFFYLFVNKKRVGYSQIAHATSEFDVTDFLVEGENVLDVVVTKWSAGTYLECQDKFRFSGIFRSVYLLKRPHKHISDFKIEAIPAGSGGRLSVSNAGEIPFSCLFGGEKRVVPPHENTLFVVENIELWTHENPALYDVVLSAEGEKILQRVGFRSSRIENGVYLFNGRPLKFKGVNRHEFSPENGATVTLEEMLRDLELMKWANVNAVRTSHYPDCPQFYDLCDAQGFYILDEADVESHGMAACGGDNRVTWQRFADSGVADDGVTDREISLYERDKNRTCVVMWSLGNESNWGKMFHRGADYIRERDSRPVHYENAWEMADKSDYYTPRIDMASRMYPPLDFFAEFLADEKEKRPLLLCEYSHSMGNSNGDLNDYWKIIDSNDRFAGAFVWEWRDHALRTEKGYLYGGDFGERLHDGNFCVDGLLNPDWTPKSGLYELRAVYGGKREKEENVSASGTLAKLPCDAPISYRLGKDGKLLSLGDVAFRNPLEINIERAYIDNDMYIRAEWSRYEDSRQTVAYTETRGNVVFFKGKMLKETFAPILDFELTYVFHDEGVDVDFSYRVADYVSYLPRIGLCFSLDKSVSGFSYRGYGPYESYVDKHLACEYGEYRSAVRDAYFHYVRPQESGSHFASDVLRLDNGMEITAETPFSFSVLPYSVEQLKGAAHDFELPQSDGTYVCLDVAMSGVGSGSCGPELREKYRAPKTGRNLFRIVLKK